MKKIVKKNYKILIGFILGIIVSGVVVYAATITSDKVSYNNKNSGMSATTMQGALDELYQKSSKKCRVVEGNKTTVGSTVNCEGEQFYISTTGTTVTLIAKHGLSSSYIQSLTPTAVNYSNATKYIENYVNNKLSWLKKSMNFYGHPPLSEIKKIGSEASGGAVYGDKVGLDNAAYWTSSTTALVYMGSVYSNSSVSSTATSVESAGAHTTYKICVRPMIKVVSSIIQ